VRVKVLGMGVLAGLFALLADGHVANAITMMTTETESFTLTAPQVLFTVTNDGNPPATVDSNSPQTASQALTFNQFDGGLGTLTGVTITFSTTYGATATVTVQSNEDVPFIDFFSDASVNHSLTNAGLIDPQSSLQLFNATCTADLDEGCTDTQADNGISFNTPPGGVGLAAPVASFVGSGTYDLTATLSSVLTPRISPDNGTAFADNSTFGGTLDATWNGSVSVVYTYETGETSVPVPSSLYLLVAGLGGIALSRRYRR
jgi:hypothetical protein